MKKTNKKGFTIVELVIVIAVIAILAGVLIPTFTSIINKAEKSAAQQEARNALTVVLAEEKADLDDGYTYYFVSDSYWFSIDGATGNELADATALTDTVIASATELTYDDLSNNVKVYKVAKAQA